MKLVSYRLKNKFEDIRRDIKVDKSPNKQEIYELIGLSTFNEVDFGVVLRVQAEDHYKMG